MSERVAYYEVGKSYGKIIEGTRFKVLLSSAKSKDQCIKEGLSEETGIPTNQINLCMLHCFES